MNSKTSGGLNALIVIADVFLLFISSILANKLSETFQLASLWTIVISAICIVALSAIGYIKSNGVSWTSSNGFRFLPRSMATTFPLGVVLGLAGGLICPLIDWPGGSVRLPEWVADFFSFSNLGLMSFEFWGIVVGSVISILFALKVDGYLAGALSIGYGLGFSTTLIVTRFHAFWPTYLGHILWFGALCWLLIKAEPMWKRLGVMLTERRI